MFISSCLIFLSLLVNRHIVTENFAYPLLTNLFNSNDRLLNEFSEFISNYRRDGFFPLNMFFVTSSSDLNVLGPTVLFIIIPLLLKYRNKLIIFKNDNLFFIGLLQLFLLISFAQGRPDYYLSPLILFISQTNIISDFFRNNKYNFIFKTTIFFQAFFFIICLTISIFQNINLISSYEKNMNNLAYGFNLSKIFNSSYPGRTLFMGRNTKLYFSSNYLDKDLMNKCVELNKMNGVKNGQKVCLDKYKVNQVISSPNYLIDDNAFVCEEIEWLRASRNPFNKNYMKKSYCRRKKLIE